MQSAMKPSVVLLISFCIASISPKPTDRSKPYEAPSPSVSLLTSVCLARTNMILVPSKLPTVKPDIDTAVTGFVDRCLDALTGANMKSLLMPAVDLAIFCEACKRSGKAQKECMQLHVVQAHIRLLVKHTDNLPGTERVFIVTSMKGFHTAPTFRSSWELSSALRRMLQLSGYPDRIQVGLLRRRMIHYSLPGGLQRRLDITTPH